MNVVFFKSKTFYAQELENSLKKRTGINLLITAIPKHIPGEAASSAFDLIKHYLPAIVPMTGALNGFLRNAGKNGEFRKCSISRHSFFGACGFSWVLAQKCVDDPPMQIYDDPLFYAGFIFNA